MVGGAAVLVAGGVVLGVVLGTHSNVQSLPDASLLMRTLLACTTMMTIAVGLGGCGTKDPCIGKSGTCISAHVDGNVKNLSGARVSLPGGRTVTTQPSSGTIKLPAQFAILVSDPVPASPFTVELDGLRGGGVVASDSQPVTIINGRGSIEFTLDEGVIGPGGGDGGAGGDMAVQNPPTVTPLDPVTTDELAPLSVTLTAADPLGGNVTLSASSLPGNAKFTPNGASGTLAWTPTFTDAGIYTVKITATPDDTSRTATYDLVITVKNAADPIVLNSTPITTAVPIGDWDKDGYGDLAICTGDAAGATGKYHITIIYRAATGMPLDATSAMGRVDSFDIAATNLGGVLYSCKGGDFDGDGHADIIFADPGNDYWNATMPGSTPNEGKFTILFGGARGTSPPPIFAVGPQNFGEHMGETYVVGDFNGDGKADIGSTWALDADTHILINGGPRVNITEPLGTERAGLRRRRGPLLQQWRRFPDAEPGDGRLQQRRPRRLGPAELRHQRGDPGAEHVHRHGAGGRRHSRDPRARDGADAQRRRRDDVLAVLVADVGRPVALRVGSAGGWLRCRR